MLSVVHDWCNKWRMKVNVNKTKVVHLKKSIAKNKTNCTFNIDDEEIKTVPCYKHLGILFDQHLSFKECAQIICDSVLKVLSSIISKLQGRIYSIIHHNTFTNYLQHLLDYFRFCLSHIGY